MVEEIMTDLAWFLALFIVLYSSPGILRQPLLLARERETFTVHVCLTVLELASLEKKKIERKKEKMIIFNGFKNLFIKLS